MKLNHPCSFYTQKYAKIRYVENMNWQVLLVTENTINEFLKRNNGQLTSEEAKRLKIPSITLTRLVKSGRLERIGRGVYIDPAIFGDDMFAIQYRFKKGIFYKDTSLFLHGMIDRTPDKYEMNFPSNYNSAALKEYPVKVHRQIDPYYSMGIEEIESPDQHLIKTYNMERTLCDIVQTRNPSDSETVNQAMNSYVKMKSKNLGLLNEYAKKLKVQSKIQTYMDILL